MASDFSCMTGGNLRPHPRPPGLHPGGQDRCLHLLCILPGGGAVASTSVKSEAASSADEGQDKDEAMVKASSNIHRLGFSTFLRKSWSTRKINFYETRHAHNSQNNVRFD